ncbi:hypothetical protein AURANDRAFT_34513 [Aureococcus anophagefferens]|uniref:glutaminase n=1 Tax=Aureococcus anophagefferens TaxID=44056 RepID=F0YP91_AURAN|nr:hypothetical protein AURANDRAFT_34513 [Aureococcus anophagefferens]EGB03070.1 hypothetical protein AURANDRAFT_34513 [Aureococcus anophagefferens]|eukprot:XP_009042234.1 hypothetical protein AURANDRAFT_34513 [Aureococcus anophagefferens]
MADDDGPLVGVLAIQGSVEEHVAVLAGLGARTREIRTPDGVAGIDGLVLPGGESTAMGIMTEGDGLWETIRAAVDGGLPVYGTCAGLVLLADRAIGQRDGGQPLIGGLDCDCCRNYFGAQVSSFEVPLAATGGASAEDAALVAKDYPAVFIRAPAILKVGKKCEALASVTVAPHASAAPAAKKQAAAEAAIPEREVVVAARQGNILVTAFHPELTDDTRWHDLFLAMVKKRTSG